MIKAKKIFSDDAPDSYLIPNRKIVSFCILEAQDELIKSFGDLTQNYVSANKIKLCYDKSVVLYFYIKQYKTILKKIENWDTFEKEFKKFIVQPDKVIDYKELYTALEWLTKAVYTLGITQIQTEKRDLNNIYRP